MGAAQWMKVFDTVTGLMQLGAPPRTPSSDLSSTEAPRGALEARLAGVVVAALKEAFDRDKTRMDLERETLEAERVRAERALQAELRRQAADRELVQLRLVAMFSGLMLLVSAVLAAWVPAMRGGVSAVLLTVAWALAVGALGCVFAAWQQVTVWATATEPPQAGSSSLVRTAPWLMLAALAAVAASLLLAR